MKRNPLQSLSYLFILILLNSVAVNAQWVPVSSPPPNFRTDHTYGFSLEGKGYLVAGTTSNGNFSNNFYQYDPLIDEFTQLDDFPGGARGFAIGDDWDGKAYFGFGIANGSNIQNDLWQYDPTTAVWTELAECPCSARFHPAMIAHNGKIFVGMGAGSFGDLKDWWIYDIASDSWTEGTEFPSTQRHHPYQFGIGDYVYTGFGHGGANIYNAWYQYDPANDSWDQMESLPAEGRVAGTQFSWTGKGYVLSGEGADHRALDEGEFWSYDPLTDSWEQLPSHPDKGRWAPASFLIDNEIYIFNGVVRSSDGGNSSHPNDSYKFNLNGDEMTSTEELEKEANFSLHPNPVSDYLSIETASNIKSSAEFNIFDVLGNTVLNFEVADKKEVDISALANGVYFVRMDGEADVIQIIVNR
ncbi:MAG: N-acetylneuraminic acid mutarotase [Polaribacter sp.]|jgi:N-acetylneuraminic acid mutarotase